MERMPVAMEVAPAGVEMEDGVPPLPSVMQIPHLAGGTSDSQEQFHMQGDPYAISEDVVRGCSFCPGPTLPNDDDWGNEIWCIGGEPGFFPDIDQLEGHKKFLSCVDHRESTDPAANTHLHSESSESEAVGFSDAFEPRELSFGQHETSSSQFVEGASAVEVATCVRNFLVQELKSSVQVKPAKFSIKAEVFDEEGGAIAHCVLKARVMRAPRPPEGAQRLLVEFRRRRGDPFAFSRIFARASRYITERLPLPQRPAPVKLEAPAAAPQPSAVAARELQPLVDMLESRGPEAQAEAVARLATLAGASAETALAVCTAVSHLQGVITALVGSTCLDLAYPAARLLTTLAFHGGPLSSAAHDSARFAGADRLVRAELAKVCCT